MEVGHLTILNRATTLEVYDLAQTLHGHVSRTPVPEIYFAWPL